MTTAAAASTTYVRFEIWADRWALNTGSDLGTMAEGADVQLWSWSHRHPHDWNSQWSYKYMGNGYWQYKNRWSKKCLDIAPGSFSAVLEQRTCDDTDRGQHWDDIPSLAPGYRSLKNREASEKFNLTMVGPGRRDYALTYITSSV